MSGFSIVNNLAADTANLELGEHQAQLATSSRDLSSGLRINTAADDPSGNAIATDLQTHAAAFTQASSNVTTAQNAASVADGALAATTNILLRIRELAVSAASTVESTSDRVQIQSEIDQLLVEINRISQNTNFNGATLLDGSHSGYQPARAASATITANSVLLASTPTAASPYLVSTTSLFNDAIQPSIIFQLQQAVTASPSPQTVKVSETQYIQAGSIFQLDGKTVTVQSVDPANGTITAIFSANGASGDVASTIANTSLTAPVAAGIHLVTVANADQPFYAGEILQVGYTSFATNDVVVIQKIVSPTSFIAQFNKPQSAGAGVYSGNETFVPANFGPGNYTYNYGGSATDSAPIGSTAYVIESSSGNQPPSNGSTNQIVATGTVVAGSLTSTTVQFTQKIPNLFGGNFQLWAPVGLGSTPLVNTVDGTIKLTVVNQSGTVGVQESFYETATQTSVTSPYLITPGERTMLYDGVVTTVGDFTAADVGSTAYIKVLQATQAVTAASTPALTIQSGADEGDVLQLGIPAINTSTLRVSTVTVIGASGTDPTFAAEDAIGQIDNALSIVTTVRAQIGAQILKLGIDQTDDDTAQNALTTSASNITDVNVGQAATAYTEDQVDIEVATPVLAQANQLAETILKLFPS